MVQRRVWAPLLLLSFSLYLLFAPSRPKVKADFDDPLLDEQSDLVVDDEGQIEVSDENLAQLVNNSSSRPISATGKPTIHILHPPEELVQYAQSCSLGCLHPSYFKDAKRLGAMGRVRGAYDATMPYELRYTSQFAAATIFHERVQAYMGDSQPEPSAEDADFILLHAEIATEMHRCSNCLGKTRTKAEAAQHRRQALLLTTWLKNTFESLQGRRDYPSVFFVMSRVGDAYKRDLLSSEVTALFGQDVVALGIEPVYRHRDAYQFMQIPYPTQFHLYADASGLPERSAAVAWMQSQQRETLISLMAGRIKVMSRAGTELRQKLSDDLSASAVQESDQVYFPDKLDRWNTMYKKMSKSTFCIQPTGDSPTRRGFYDSVLLGCIPVIFSKTAYQSFGSPAIDLNDLAVLIPHEEYLQEHSEDLLSRLQSIPQGIINEKQQRIAEVAPALQYSLLSPDMQSSTGLVDDAFGRIMRHLFQQGGFEVD